jgi:hypothetical protein
MFEFPSPAGKAKRFSGDIEKYNKDAFGFFYVKVEAPNDLNIPILQKIIKSKSGGIVTMAPLGR